MNATPGVGPTPGNFAPTPMGMPLTAAGMKNTTPVDVNAVLEEMAKQSGEKLNWRDSIVDLLKLLKLDSSIVARRELAKELNYSGSTEDSASMNMWLQKQVMSKLAENGGQVPDSLRA